MLVVPIDAISIIGGRKKRAQSTAANCGMNDCTLLTTFFILAKTRVATDDTKKPCGALPFIVLPNEEEEEESVRRS